MLERGQNRVKNSTGLALLVHMLKNSGSSTHSRRQRLLLEAVLTIAVGAAASMAPATAADQLQWPRQYHDTTTQSQLTEAGREWLCRLVLPAQLVPGLLDVLLSSDLVSQDHSPAPHQAKDGTAHEAVNDAICKEAIRRSQDVSEHSQGCVPQLTHATMQPTASSTTDFLKTRRICTSFDMLEPSFSETAYSGQQPITDTSDFLVP